MRNNLTEVEFQHVEDVKVKKIYENKVILADGDEIDFTHLFLNAPRTEINHKTLKS